MGLPQPYTKDLKLQPSNMATHRIAPMPKEEVADLFGVTPRTIENWIEHEGLPAPVQIGNRVFWHPDVFYEWLDQRLRKAPAKPADDALVDAPRKRVSAGKSERAQLQSRNSARLAAIEGR